MKKIILIVKRLVFKVSIETCTNDNYHGNPTKNLFFY